MKIVKLGHLTTLTCSQLEVNLGYNVVSHPEHVIVTGGGLGENTDHDDTDVLKWIEK